MLSNAEDSQAFIVSHQVKLSSIIHDASSRLYSQNANIDLEHKSKTAMKLDDELERWKSSLPHWLDPEIVSFKEPERTTKQKLALEIGTNSSSRLRNCPYLGSSNEMIRFLPHQDVHPPPLHESSIN
jgi:hypothetical protein